MSMADKCECNDPFHHELNAFGEVIFEKAKDVYHKSIDELMAKRGGGSIDEVPRFGHAAARAFLSVAVNIINNVGMPSEIAMLEFAEMLNMVREQREEQEEAEAASGGKENLPS
jgi:hypothetical protein